MSEERRHRSFWAVTPDHRVRMAEGYECPPNEGLWWVPEIGYTMTYGHHLFDTEGEALHKALTEVQNEIARLRDRAEELIARIARPEEEEGREG